MTVYLLPGVMGLLLGLLLHWAGFVRSARLRDALALRPGIALRAGLTALGWAILLTALLIWLAVIDVDLIPVVPLTAGSLLGGALLGICAGLSGFTPATAFAGLGGNPSGGHTLEALSVLAGCFLGGLLLPPIAMSPLTTASLDGRWIALALIITAMFLRHTPRHKSAAEDPSSIPHSEFRIPNSECPPSPADAPDETFIALLPEEEPLIIDTALDENAPEEDSPPPSPEPDPDNEEH